MSVEVRRSTVDEIGEVMRFIDEHWARGHILSKHRPLVDFQHFDAEANRYDFVVARRASDRAILGLLGFIPTRRYDPALAEHSTLWLALWKTRPDAGVTALGFQLLRTLTEIEPHEAIAVAGINEAHPPMYRRLGWVTGEMTQHFILNPELRAHRIARIPDGWTRAAPRGDATLEPLTREGIPAAAAEIATRPELPRKSATYFQRRFFDHPIYRYEVHLVRFDRRPIALLATRVARHDGAAVVRIVDLLGPIDTIARIGRTVERLVVERGAEYADFFSAGVPNATFEAAGFSHLDPDGALVLPNYFEPFKAKNGRIRYAFKGERAPPFALFRADGDQDRPSEVPA